MKIDDVVLDETVDKRDRNVNITINTPVIDGDAILTCEREVILCKSGKRINTGGANGEKVYVVRKLLSEIATQEVTVGGTTLTAAQIAAFVEALSDLYIVS